MEPIAGIGGKIRSKCEFYISARPHVDEEGKVLKNACIVYRKSLLYEGEELKERKV